MYRNQILFGARKFGFSLVKCPKYQIKGVGDRTVPLRIKMADLATSSITII